jgi:hypothetical protein
MHDYEPMVGEPWPANRTARFCVPRAEQFVARMFGPLWRAEVNPMNLMLRSVHIDPRSLTRWAATARLARWLDAQISPFARAAHRRSDPAARAQAGKTQQADNPRSRRN